MNFRKLYDGNLLVENMLSRAVIIFDESFGHSLFDHVSILWHLNLAVKTIKLLFIRGLS